MYIIKPNKKKSLAALDLLQFIESHLDAYTNARNRNEKSDILVSVIHTQRENSADGVGFVRYDKSSCRFFKMEDFEARVAVAQSFRDCLSKKYRSSKQFKRNRRRELKKKERQQLLPVAATPAMPAACDGKDSCQGKDMSLHTLAAATAAAVVKRSQDEDRYKIKQRQCFYHLREYSSEPAIAPSDLRTIVHGCCDDTGPFLSETSSLPDLQGESFWKACAQSAATADDLLFINSRSLGDTLLQWAETIATTNGNPFEPKPILEQDDTIYSA